MKRINSMVITLAMVVSSFVGINTVSFASDEDVTEIYTIEDLYGINDNLNGNYKLMNNLDLSEATTEGGAYYNDGNGWRPIGDSDNPFSGTFDGNDKTIEGININSSSECNGLFGYLSSAEIKNLTVSGQINVETTSSGTYIGGIAGNSGTSAIHDCNNDVDITADMKSTTSTSEFYLGGVSGDGSNIYNCVNTGKITSNYKRSSAGGIVGKGTARNCNNSGTIFGGKNVGGIAGDSAEYYSSSNMVSNCKNEGTVNCDVEDSTIDAAYAGGITGKGPVCDSVNVGSVSATSILRDINAGGISGATGTVGVSTSTNYGKIIATYPSKKQGEASAGGIAGRCTEGNYCANFGDVYAYNTASYAHAGGIAGYTGGNGSCSGCCNFGTIESVCDNLNYYTATAGGIAGAYYDVSSSYNAGTVISSSAAGGITGVSGNISNCYNVGTVNGSYYTGGISGYDARSISCTYNAGILKGPRIGGIIGKNSKTVENSYFLDAVSMGASNDEYIGESKTIEELNDASSYGGFDFDSVWSIDAQATYTLPILIDVADAEKQSELTTSSNIAFANIELDRLHYIYTGAEIKPAVSISIGSSLKLEEGTDYNVAYKNNINAGTGEVVISGIGEYAGTAIRKFEIHTIEKKEYTEPSCVEDGNNEYYLCSCGKCFSDSQGENEIAKESVVLAATGHDIVLVKAKEPTCNNPGNEKYWKCTKCNEYYADSEGSTIIADHNEVVIETTGHSYGTFVQEPTCTQKGYTLHICARCGDTYTDNEVECTGHNWSQWNIIRNSTCAEHGFKQRECSACGIIQTYDMDYEEHEWADDYVTDSEPTCTEDGSKSIHCENCNAVKDSVVLKASGHDYSEWEQVSKETCEENGEYKRVCANCHYVETVKTLPKGHQYVHFEIPAKVGIAGKSYDKCTACEKEINVKSLSALNPSGTAIVSLKKASKAFTVKWKKKAYTGYQIRYSTSSSMKSAKTVTVKGANTVSKKVKKLKAKKTYYVQVRTYKTVSGKNWYSAWSSKKSVKTK